MRVFLSVKRGLRRHEKYQIIKVFENYRVILLLSVKKKKIVKMN